LRMVDQPGLKGEDAKEQVAVGVHEVEPADCRCQCGSLLRITRLRYATTCFFVLCPTGAIGSEGDGHVPVRLSSTCSTTSSSASRPRLDRPYSPTATSSASAL